MYANSVGAQRKGKRGRGQMASWRTPLWGQAWENEVERD